MSLPTKAMFRRLLAIALCLVALNIYIAIAPVTTTMADDVCDCSHCGICNSLGQRCVCLFQGSQCLQGIWSDDNQCKCKKSC